MKWKPNYFVAYKKYRYEYNCKYFTSIRCACERASEKIIEYDNL